MERKGMACYSINLSERSTNIEDMNIDLVNKFIYASNQAYKNNISRMSCSLCGNQFDVSSRNEPVDYNGMHLHMECYSEVLQQDDDAYLALIM